MDHLLKKDAEQYSRFYCYITIDYFKAKSENKLILSAQFHSHFISNYRVCWSRHSFYLEKKTVNLYDSQFYHFLFMTVLP